jgi:putative Mg2+ transporter-C (MgtC) family protein
MSDLLQQISDAFHFQLLIQLLLAILLGGAVGLERELSGKPAGLRTNILICVGATLFTVLSLKLSGVRGDPARVAAQILPGVGFIGAGTIMHARGSVSGLTSAATIWVVSAIGMALGAGAFEEALGTALLVIIVLQGLGWLERYVSRRSTYSHLLVHARPGGNPVENVDLVIELELRGAKRLHDQAMLALLHHPAVRTVSTGE